MTLILLQVITTKTRVSKQLCFNSNLSKQGQEGITGGKLIKSSHPSMSFNNNPVSWTTLHKHLKIVFGYKLYEHHFNEVKACTNRTVTTDKTDKPETGTEPKDKEIENETKKLEREKNITYTPENIKNNRKNLTEKYGKNRVQHVEERIDVVAVEIRSIQTKTKQQEHDEVINKV